MALSITKYFSVYLFISVHHVRRCVLYGADLLLFVNASEITDADATDTALTTARCSMSMEFLLIETERDEPARERNSSHFPSRSRAIENRRATVAFERWRKRERERIREASRERSTEALFRDIALRYYAARNSTITTRINRARARADGGNATRKLKRS